MVARSMSLVAFITNHQYHDVTMVEVFGELCKYGMLAQQGQRRDYEAEQAVQAQLTSDSPMMLVSATTNGLHDAWRGWFVRRQQTG